MTEQQRDHSMSQQMPPEADATPDEAFELGEVHGYDKGYADGIASVPPPTREQVAAVAYSALVSAGVYMPTPESEAVADAVLALFQQPTPSTEPTVQMPVSLLRDIVYTEPQLTGWLGRAAALLPQPTPSAEPVSIDPSTIRDVTPPPVD